jgi:hypothetical protein
VRLSATLIGIGLVLVAIQAAGSNRGPLMDVIPGLQALTAGLIALAAGIIVGAVRGTRPYRIAMLLALLGSAFVAFGVLFMTIGGPGRRPTITVNEASLLAGAAVWMVAVVLAVQAIRRDAAGRTAVR